MTWEEYKEQAARTMIDRGHDHNKRHLISGIGTELFELQDIFKRYYAYGKNIDIIHVKEELGDAYWYEGNRERLVGQFLNSNLDEFNSIEAIMDEINCFDFAFKSIKPLLEKIAEYFKIELSDIWQTNINKLKIRFPEKFNFEDALNRDLNNERKILEQ